MKPQLTLGLLCWLAACGEDEPPIDGNVAGGRRLIAELGCGACHVVPGVAGANGTVGPPLTAFAKRAYIAGRLPNAPEHLLRWLLDPPSVDPQTAMPNLGLTAVQARDVAAFLYSLK